MGLKAYLSDIWEAVATTAKGMRITARYGVNPKEEITLQYPEQRWEPAGRFRGFLHNDIARCTSCTMCVRVCPIDCISLESVRGADKKLVLVSYDINIGRCMYCGLCVEVCPPKSLVHTSGYEMASTERGELILHSVHEEPEEIRSRVAKQVAEAAAKAEAAKAEAAKQAAGAAPAVEPKQEAPAPAAAGNIEGVASEGKPAQDTAEKPASPGESPGGGGEEKE